jgi:hypothetical protein
MRSYKVYGKNEGWDEEYVATIHSAEEGKAYHRLLKMGGIYDYIRCRDCLGGLQFEINLHTGQKTA